MTITRVRAALVTPAGALLVIRREIPGRPTYWSMPGGGIETYDAGMEDAIEREVREEVGGVPRLHSVTAVIEAVGDEHAIFLASIDTWSEADRTGPEFTDPRRGAYLLEEVELAAKCLSDLDLWPEPAASFLTDQLAQGRDLFMLPDLRRSGLRWQPRRSVPRPALAPLPRQE